MLFSISFTERASYAFQSKCESDTLLLCRTTCKTTLIIEKNQLLLIEYLTDFLYVFLLYFSQEIPENLDDFTGGSFTGGSPWGDVHLISFP